MFPTGPLTCITPQRVKIEQQIQWRRQGVSSERTTVRTLGMTVTLEIIKFNPHHDRQTNGKADDAALPGMGEDFVILTYKSVSNEPTVDTPNIFKSDLCSSFTSS